jgi:long-chain acyl-CoA synthetase
MDQEGYLYFVSRETDITKTRGEKVSPREVEEVLYGIEGVAEAAVVGTPDALLGDAIKAVICLRPGYSVTAHEVKRQCAARLENFMVPKEVEFRSSMPKTSSGKIARRELAALTMEGAA